MTSMVRLRNSPLNPQCISDSGFHVVAARIWIAQDNRPVQRGGASSSVSANAATRRSNKLTSCPGPIVRVTPYELHIRDSRMLDIVYPAGVFLDKERWDRSFGEGGVLQTHHAAVHKRRRAALNPMFSKRSIMDVIHIVHRHIDEFQTRILEFEARKEPLNVTWAFPALTGDIIMDYFFGFNYGSTKDPGFSSFHAAFKVVGLTGHIAMQFPWFLPVRASVHLSIR
jgi:hypothetical protein